MGAFFAVCCGLAGLGQPSPAWAQTRRLEVAVECSGDIQQSNVCDPQSRTEIAKSIQDALGQAFPFFIVQLAAAGTPDCGRLTFTLSRAQTDWFLDGKFRSREKCDQPPAPLKISDPIARTDAGHERETPPRKDFQAGAAKALTQYFNSDPDGSRAAAILQGIPLATGAALDPADGALPLTNWELRLPVETALWDKIVVGRFKVSYHDQDSKPHTLNVTGRCREAQGERTVEVAVVKDFPCQLIDRFDDQKHAGTLKNLHDDLIYITKLGQTEIDSVDCPNRSDSVPVRDGP